MKVEHGLAAYGELGFGRLDMAMLTTWATERFTQANALVLVDDRPAELELPLAAGQWRPPPAAEPLRLRLPLPGYIVHDGGVSLTGLGPPTRALERRQPRLRGLGPAHRTSLRRDGHDASGGRRRQPVAGARPPRRAGPKRRERKLELPPVPPPSRP